MTAALTTLKVMPTGGISASNVVEYLQNSKIFCAGGSWMVKGDMIKAGQFAEIKDMVAVFSKWTKDNPQVFNQITDLVAKFKTWKKENGFPRPGHQSVVMVHFATAPSLKFSSSHSLSMMVRLFPR